MNFFKSNKSIIFSCIIIISILTTAFVLYTYQQRVATSNSEYVPDYYVTYRMEDGTILSREGVSAGEAALPKIAVPEIGGKVFIGWNQDLTSINADTETFTNYLDVSKDDNVVALPVSYGTYGNIMKLPLKILGNVNLCGADITLSYDTALLEFKGTEQEDKAVTVNTDHKAGLIYIRFVSAENATGEIDLSVLRFKITGAEKTNTDIKVFVKDMVKFDEEKNIVPAPYNVMDEKLHIF